MLHTLTLVVVPVTGGVLEVRKQLSAERFTLKHGTHVQPSGSEAVVGISCADFHDVSVSLDKLSGLIKPMAYLMDARGKLYLYQPMRNTLDSLGYAVPYNEGSTVSTGQNFFDFGGLRWAYLPL